MTYVREYLLSNDFDAGEATFPRRVVFTTSGTTSGALRLAYFTARKSETISQVRMATGGTAASGITLCRIGIYEVDSSGDLTLVASTPNDTDLFIATNTSYTKSLSASFSKKTGSRYAVGTLLVGTTMPNFQANTPPSPEVGQAPRLGAAVFSLSDLPSPTISAGSLSNTTNQFYTVLLP